VLDVLDVAGCGGGSDLPVVGMLPTTPVVGISPAKIEVDSTHISTTAIANFFMDCLFSSLLVLLMLEKMP